MESLFSKNGDEACWGITVLFSISSSCLEASTRAFVVENATTQRKKTKR